MTKKHWLTEKQKKVLRMREEGKSQAQIANEMGTTRSNISAIENNARKNIEKSERTLELAEILKSQIKFTIEKPVDIYDIPRIVFKKGDEENIKINLTGPELLRKVKRKAEPVLQGKELKGGITVGISQDGEVRIEPEGNNRK